ncbi:MAG: diaminopropionate ammonia-lyase [Granulosicoccus sp.]|nr:diaminopropionate ammonia-lyase [Granulosicoccus sp.]
MRPLRLGVAQLGPIPKDHDRQSVVQRQIHLLHQASDLGAQFVVFPELAFTTFFPRFQIADDALDPWFEDEMPGAVTSELFECAVSLGLGFSIGYAERVETADQIHRYNTSILVNPQGEIVGKYRKIHLPGHDEFEPWRAFQHLEKRYFEPGDLGFDVWPVMGARVGMCICNDRRWPETWRVLGLAGAELVTLGYNTPVHYPPVPQHDHLQSFHHLLPMQAGAYQNGTYVAAAAKAGLEEGSVLLGHSCIIAPTGEVIAMSHTQGDELIVADCDFDKCEEIKQHIFNFEMHRQPQHYRLIAESPTPKRPLPPLLNTDVHCRHVVNKFRQQIAISDDSPFASVLCQQANETIQSWPGYEFSPIHSLSGLAERSGIASIWYKDEAGRFGIGSFKSLGGAYAVSELLKQHVHSQTGQLVGAEQLTDGSLENLTRSITVTCATDGNHGRSVAWGAKQFGCNCIIYIHKDVSRGREEAIHRFGADVLRVDGNYDDSVRQAAADAEQHGRIVVSDTSYPGYVDIPADVMRGYTVLADEALDQLGEQVPTHVFLQGGVGGFAAAIAARIRDRLSDHVVRIVVVEPENAACIFESIEIGKPVAVTGDLETVMAGLSCGEVSILAFELLKDQVDDVMTVPDSLSVACMRLLAKGVQGDRPLVAGESAVGGLAGLLFARQNRELAVAMDLSESSRVLLIGTEGATDPAIYTQIVGSTPEHINQQCPDS